MLSLIKQIAKTVVQVVSFITILVISIPLILVLITWSIGTLGQIVLFFPDWLKVVLIPTFALVIMRYIKDII